MVQGSCAESRRTALIKILAGISGAFFWVKSAVFSDSSNSNRKFDLRKIEKISQLYGGEFGRIKPEIRRNKYGRL